MKEYLKERERQIELLKLCKETPDKAGEILSEFPKLAAGVKKGTVKIDDWIGYLERHNETYKNAKGDHFVRQIKSDGEFSVQIFEDSGFYKKLGVEKPDENLMNTHVNKLITQYKKKRQDEEKKTKRSKKKAKELGF